MYKKLNIIKLKQKSNAWLDLKDTRIGSSEIYGLVKHYIKPEELESLGINSEEFKEKPYTTAWEIYHKFANKDIYTREPLKWVFAEYGNAIEKYAYKWIQEKGNFEYGESAFNEGEVYTNDDDIRIASLDIEGMVNSTRVIQDSNGHNISLKDDKEFIVEVKAMSKFKAIKDKILKNGVDWKYILQLQYQLWCTNKPWGIMLVMELLHDTLDKRGYIIRCGETLNKTDCKYIDNATKKSMFIYKKLPQYAKIFELALERFKNDLKFKNEPKFLQTENKVFLIKLLKRRNQLMNTDIVLREDFDEFFAQHKKKKIEEGKLKVLRGQLDAKLLQNGKYKVVSKHGKISYGDTGRMTVTIKKDK